MSPAKRGNQLAIQSIANLALFLRDSFGCGHHRLEPGCLKTLNWTPAFAGVTALVVAFIKMNYRLFIVHCLTFIVYSTKVAPFEADWTSRAYRFR